MDYEMIEKKVKYFILSELETARKFHKNDNQRILNCRAIAFGALQFAINNLFPCYNADLAKWWDEEAWKEFDKLLRGDENE